MSYPGTQYRVYITPRESASVYGDEVEVTDRVELKGLSQIKKNLDGGDYDIGAYVYSDVTLSCQNPDGFFNNERDSRSMFPYSRDLAKVRVVFNRDIDQETVTYRGIINDEGTRLLVKEDRVTFRVLSRDSVIRKSKIAGGTELTNQFFSGAIYIILNQDIIQKVLSIDPANINVGFDGVVDEGSSFTDRNTWEALKDLLLFSNSVMVINEDDEIIVRSRDENTDKEPLRLYGAGNLKNLENIADIQNFNTGLQRVFNSIKINETRVIDSLSVEVFGVREKETTADWITDDANLEAIANSLLTEFAYPKLELQVKVDTFIAKEYDLLDRVSIDYPLRVYPTSLFLPIAGVTAAGDIDSLTPIVKGSVSLDPRMGFKIIEISEDTKSFMSTLKLRQIGVTTTDGYL